MEEFVHTAFDVLNTDSLASILSYLTPLEVVNFCQVKSYEKLCDSESLFRTLLRKHYPREKIMKEGPKYTYLELTYIPYKLRYVIEGRIFTDTLGVRHRLSVTYKTNATRLKEFDEVGFIEDIFGVKASFTNDKVWIIVSHHEEDGTELTACRTLNDAIDYFIKTYLYTEDLIDMFEDSGEGNVEDNFDDYVTFLLDWGFPEVKVLDNGYLDPENMKDYINKNRFFPLNTEFFEYVEFLQVNLVQNT